MTYVESGYLPNLRGCSQDGMIVHDTEQHDAWHKYLESRLQLHGQRLLEAEEELAVTREELSDADVTAQGVSERAAAAVRYAEAARAYFNELVVDPPRRREIMAEMKAASELWERIR